MEQETSNNLFASLFEEPTILTDYMEQVASGPLRRFKATFQHGKKAGESLYTHILNGITALETIRPLVGLDDDEASSDAIRLLFTAFTLHDINKFTSQRGRYGDIATPEQVKRYVVEFDLEHFFPQYEEYLHDIVELMRAHSGHHNWDVVWLDRTRVGRFKLGDRLRPLVHLMRAVDNLDLSQTLDEWRRHKDKFLSEFNAACDETQYDFFIHRVTEHRGILTNIIHNSIVEELQKRYGLIPLLFYPDGVAYLLEANRRIVIDDEVFESLARRIAGTLQRLTASKFQQFIDVRPLGIRIDAKCLELGLAFEELMGAVDTIIQRRSFNSADLREKARGRTQRRLADLPADDPRAQAVAALLDDPALIPESSERLRLAEFIRTYYIFLNEHFKKVVPDAWARIYDLLNIPAQSRDIYEYFDARLDRAYVIMRDLQLSTDDVWQRIVADGGELLGQRESADPRVPLFTDYLRQVVRFNAPGQERPDFRAYLGQYVANQHRQCVHCSSSFPTEPWMKPDVRSEISVNTFSNRLPGGPGEPKKYICAICKIQFLVEKLSFKEVRGEKILYLHLYPYSFQTAPFLKGLQARVARLTRQEDTVALFLSPEQYLQQEDDTQVELRFAKESKKGKPHVNGIYVPLDGAVVGNLIIEPINPPGGNDTERFLYVLQTAIILQRHTGMKVLVSSSPVPPLGKEDMGDLYLDIQPLSMQGLVDGNNFTWLRDGTDAEGNLADLLQRIRALVNLQSRLRSPASQRNPAVELARALTVHPLEIFYVGDRLLENKFSDDRRLAKGQQTAIRIREVQTILPQLETLALATKRRAFVEKVSTQLKRLAEIAWTSGLRGRSLEKHSLMVPLDECFSQLNHPSKAFDEEALRAATVTEIFEYLKRTAQEGRRPGARKWNAVKMFVNTFFDGLYHGVYGGSKQHLLNDERRLRSAFFFYIQERIARKEPPPAEEEEDQPIEETLA
ncbi:MAG: hypothetical protein KatS3mg057_2571 [Herpetosiphonaceae bacterium]|nr:MAG: hypothetical protein KatS3mg057_2571 [Herpetosiphonaceae bacterium]